MATESQKRIVESVLKQKAQRLLQHGINPNLSVFTQNKSKLSIEIRADKQHVKSK